MEILYPVQNQKSKDSIKYFFQKKNPLLKDEIENIIETFDEISKYWLSNNFKLRDMFISNSMGFIVPWLQKKKYN